MSVVEPGAGAAGLIERVKSILLKPTEEWQKIDGERPTIKALYTSYIMPLAAIPVIAGAIGSIVFGVGNAEFHVTLNPVAVIVSAIVQYAAILAAVYVMALVIDALAETFGGKRDQVQAFKISAYSATAGWLAGIFGLFPPLAVLGILGLYSIFLLYRGLPILMKSPPERAIAYTASVVIVLLVVGIVLGALTTCAMGFGGLRTYGALNLQTARA